MTDAVPFLSMPRSIAYVDGHRAGQPTPEFARWLSLALRQVNESASVTSMQSLGPVSAPVLARGDLGPVMAMPDAASSVAPVMGAQIEAGGLDPV